MNPGGITGEHLRKKYYEAWQFLGGYLHQDWAHDYDSWERAIDHAVSESTRGHIDLVLKQLERILALRLSATELAATLTQLGCCYWPGRHEAYEPWLRAVVTRIRNGSTTNAI